MFMAIRFPAPEDAPIREFVYHLILSYLSKLKKKYLSSWNVRMQVPKNDRGMYIYMYIYIYIYIHRFTNIKQ